jgi:HK97 family phage major capsid protein
LAAEAQQLLTPNMDAAAREKYDRIMTDVDALAGDIVRAERAEALEAELRSSVRPPLEQVGGNGNNAADETRKAAHSKAFREYLKSGDVTELRTYSPMSDSVQGAYIVPQGFQTTLTEALKAFGGVRKVAAQISTAAGNDLKWPTVNDTTNVGELIAENSGVSQANPSFGTVTLKAYTFSTKMVNVSNELLQDSAFDIEAYLRSAFVKRLGRAQNSYFTNGTGSGQPNGIVTTATAGPTTATTLVVGYDDLVELEHSVDPAYRQGAKFMFSDAVLKGIKKLKDTLNRPLWVPGVADKEPDTVLGYQYVINQDMPAVASGNALALFGALDNYLVRDVKELAVLRLSERYADLYQTAFVGFARADANLIDALTHPVKKLISA